MKYLPLRKEQILPGKSNGYVFADSETDETAVEIRSHQAHTAGNPGRNEATRQDSTHITETVLVVEDDNALRKFVSQVLLTQGYRILTAANGVQALQLAERHPGPIDALVTDINMPYLGGPEVAQQLTEQRPDMGVILMSGSVDETISARNHGWHFLKKPFAPSEVIAQVADALGREPCHRAPRAAAATRR